MAQNKKEALMEQLSVPRLFIYPEDIARMRGCSLSAATALYYRIRRKLKKQKGGEITYKEYCHYVQVWEDEVLPYMRMPLTLQLLLIGLLLFSFSRLAVNRIPAVKHFFDEHRIEWQEFWPGYQKGTTKVRNSKTGKMETVTVEVEDMSR